MPRPRLRGCTTCRDRHLRCDRATPTCSNCSRLKTPRKCVYGNLEVRHSSYSTKYLEKHRQPVAEPDQGPASFTRRLSNITPATSSQPDTTPIVCSSPASIGATALQSAFHLPTAYSPPFSGPLEHESPGNSELGTVPAHHTESQNVLSTALSPWASHSPGGFSTTLSNVPITFCETAATPRTAQGHTEEFVFGFYLSHAGPWLDIVSSSQHFGRTVPRLALRDPVLYRACLAYASHVLLLHGMVDESVHEEYSNEVISILIPLLSPDRVHAGNENILSTAVILRMSEQFSEFEDDAKYHLHGACSLFTAFQERWSPTYTSLGGVSFWIYLRESIRVCFLNEEGCNFNLDMVDDDLIKTTASQSEEAWANHMSYLLASLCDACWGRLEGELKVAAIEKVRMDIDEWRAGLPDGFRPWYSRQVTWQQFHTAKVMLAVYGSTKPEPSNVLAWSQYLETEILFHARMACSVCFSSSVVGCNINGCHLIAWCGQFFTGKEEQRLLLDFLKNFMEVTKWPNQTCYDKLNQIWKGGRQTWKDA